MGSTRRSFTDEYKVEAVAVMIGGGRPVAEVACSIGVHEMPLGKRVKKQPEMCDRPGWCCRAVRKEDRAPARPGVSPREIARRIDRAPLTVSRELRRNATRGRRL